MSRLGWVIGVWIGSFIAACGGTSQVDVGAEDSSGGAGGAPGAPSLWDESSSEIVIEHFSYTYSVATHESTSSYACRRWPRSSMSDEQLAYLSALEPYQGRLRGLCDASSSTTVTVVDTSSSWQQLQTDDSTGPCGSPVLEALLPAAVVEKFPGQGSLPCVECNVAVPCAEGVCVQGKCAN